MSVSPFLRLTGARQRDDCFFSRVTNARTSIGFAGGRGILAVVRHLAHSLIEVIHTHPPVFGGVQQAQLKTSHPELLEPWRLTALMSRSPSYSKLFNRGVID